MVEEEILLLIKEGRHRDAIQKYVDKQDFEKAEKFCLNQDKQLGLLTTLLTIYFQYYEENMKVHDDLVNKRQTAEAIKFA